MLDRGRLDHCARAVDGFSGHVLVKEQEASEPTCCPNLHAALQRRPNPVGDRWGFAARTRIFTSAAGSSRFGRLHWEHDE